MGDVRDVAGAGERLAGGVWQDGGELVEHHREEGWGLGAIAEQYRTTKAGKGCSVDAENIGVAGFIEESRGVVDQHASLIVREHRIPGAGAEDHFVESTSALLHLPRGDSVRDGYKGGGEVLSDRSRRRIVAQKIE